MAAVRLQEDAFESEIVGVFLEEPEPARGAVPYMVDVIAGTLSGAAWHGAIIRRHGMA